MKNDAADGIFGIDPDFCEGLTPEQFLHWRRGDEDALAEDLKKLNKKLLIRDSQPVNHGVVEALHDARRALDSLPANALGIGGDGERDGTTHWYIRDELVQKILSALATVTECKCGVMEKLLKDASGHLDWVLGQYDCLPPHMKSEKTIERQENLKVLVAKIAALGGKEKK